jgi:hypothetical protein
MRLRFLAAFFVIASLTRLSAAEPDLLPKFTAEPDEEMNALLQRREGWIGADGNYSVSLGQGRTLWLFSDTWVGKIENGRRVGATIVNNSAAVQEGIGKEAKVRIFVRRDAEGKPAALIVPADGHGWFWLQAGALVDGRLYLFLSQIEKTGEPGVFGFRQIGQWLGVVENPDDEPMAWRIEQKKLPNSMFTAERNVCFGAATLRVGDDLYVYGIDEDRQKNPLKRRLIVARVAADKVDEFPSWRFFADGQWTDSFRRASPLADGMASEFSVSYLPRLRRYIVVYTENGLSAKIMARASERPEGPWSEPVKLYACPEAGWDKNIFCYAAKAHPELCGDDELLITYAANSFDFGQVVLDSRLYWPKFVRVTLEAAR